MTPYTKLKFHLERHAYKRGQFKGEAPADASRRAKNHFRVGKQGDTMCVVMYHTNLIEVTPEDTVRISMGGWWTNTTKANLNEAMRHFLGWGGVGSLRAFNNTQMAIRTQGKTYRFYDGMEFTIQGELLSPPQFFERKQVDRDATKEFRDDMAECGFKGVWPVLFSSTEPARSYQLNSSSLRKFITQECHANMWGDIAAHYKCYYDDHKDALAAITRVCTSDMKETVLTDVTVL